MTMQRLYVKRLSDDKLSCEEWSFYFSPKDCNIYLDTYVRMTKATARHKFRTDYKSPRYNRLMGRDCTMEEHEVPLPDDVKQEVYKKFTDSITVKRWSERRI